MSSYAFAEPVRPQGTLAEFEGQIVTILAQGQEVPLHIGGGLFATDSFESTAVMCRVLGVAPGQSAVAERTTLVFPAGIKAEALRCAPKWTKPAILAKVPHTNKDKAAQGYTVWVLQPITDAQLAAAVSAFSASAS